MFDDYKDSQSVAYRMIKNSILMNRVSHAYLIDSNNFTDINGFISSFVKLLLCPYGYSNDLNCGECSRCMRIENGNDPEVRYIYPDGLYIKKEQLKDLQEEFNLSSIEGNRRVYVIWNCEKMNVQASNSILKFLEEPVSNIVAILVTSNIDSILPTIVSRCQYIKLVNNSKFDNTLDYAKNLIFEITKDREIEEIDVDNYVNSILKFSLYFEEHKNGTIVYMKKLWLDIFNDRISFIIGFQLLISLYYDILKYKLYDKLEFYVDYEVKVIKIANMLKTDDVINRINVLIKYMELIKYNLNLNLLMDSLVIELGE